MAGREMARWHARSDAASVARQRLRRSCGVSPEQAAAARLDAERAAVAAERAGWSRWWPFLDTCAKCLAGARRRYWGRRKRVVELVLKVATQVIMTSDPGLS